MEGEREREGMKGKKGREGRGKQQKKKGKMYEEKRIISLVLIYFVISNRLKNKRTKNINWISNTKIKIHNSYKKRS